jgi:hypothetical protein
MFRFVATSVRARRLSLGVVTSLGVLVACAPNVDLAAVQKYAATAQQAQASFEAVAEDSTRAASGSAS